MPYPAVLLVNAIASSRVLDPPGAAAAVTVWPAAFAAADATAVAAWPGRGAAPQPRTTVVASSAIANRGAAAGM